MNDPRNSLANHSQRLSQTYKALPQSSSPYLFTKNVSLQADGNDSVYAPTHAREKAPRPLRPSQKAIQAKMSQESSGKAENMEINSKGKQRNERNYMNLNRSLISLGRKPASSASGDEIPVDKTKDMPKKTQTDSKSSNFELQPFSGIGTKSMESNVENEKRIKDSTQKVKDNDKYEKSVYASKKEKQNQEGRGLSIAEFNRLKTKNEIFDSENNSHRDFLQKHMRKNEDGLPEEEGDFIGGSFSPNYYGRMGDEEEKKIYITDISSQIKDRDSKSTRETAPLGQKQTSEAADSRRTYYHRPSNESNENQSLLMDNISDDVKYKKGGVGYSAGGRKKRQEGESFVHSTDKKDIIETGHEHGYDEKRAVKYVQKETMEKWKHDLSEIKRDIEKRKKSYEKVEKFIIMYDENRISPSKGGAEKNIQETSPFFPGSNHFTLVANPSHSTQPTFQTFPTQTRPSRGLFERVSSPDFALNIIDGSSKTILNANSRPSNGVITVDKLKPWQRPDTNKAYTNEERITSHVDRFKFGKADSVYRDDYLRYAAENEQEKRLCQISCCGTNSGCQMF